MKKLVVVALIGSLFTLTGCPDDGFSALPPKMEKINDGDDFKGVTGIGGVDTIVNSNWRYSGNPLTDFTLTARNTAIDGYLFAGTIVKPTIYLGRTEIDNRVAYSFRIDARSKVKCTISCRILIDFNGVNAIYSMKPANSTNLELADRAEAETLYKLFVRSTSAAITLPLESFESIVTVTFDTKGFDDRRMQLGSESLCSVMQMKTCDQISSCVEAKQQLECNESLDIDGDGTPCENICS